MHAEKPVFIVAAPRSGSTLLFETLSRHQQLWSFGDEGHGWIEDYPQLRPLPGGVASNRLTEAHLTEELIEKLRADMLAALVDHQGRALTEDQQVVRVVEKTPKNCLRIPFINAIYPDARYIYLYRDPRENIASIMEGWRHQRFVTYREIRTPHGYWCFLRPPGWQRMVNAPLADIAAYQWALSHNIMLDDLAAVDRSRWMVCSFEAFVQDPVTTVQALESFAGLAHDEALAAHSSRPLPYSRYTHTPPAQDKWRVHEAEIRRVFPKIRPIVERINEGIALPGYPLETGVP